MKYFYLLFAGILISWSHFYVVWLHRKSKRLSLSEHAMLSNQSRIVYFLSHLIGELFYMLFSYQFFIVEHNLIVPFCLNIGFVVFDFVQAILPSRNKTEDLHIASAYISWWCYLLAGVICLFSLAITEPYKAISAVLLVPILGMFFYMHIRRYKHLKIYPYQLVIVPLFVVYMLFIALGASSH